MRIFKRNPKRVLHPIPQDIIEAHKEALAAKAETEHRAPFFKELAENMIHRHKENGFGRKLEATYEGKGIL